MKLSEYTALARGTKSDLARSLNLPAQLIGQWANGIRAVPVFRCIAIERATAGAVTRRDLRPDDWWQIWPEMAQSTPSHATPQEVSHG
jgi:DNA-binding transcriptional regulator YdaS (Cro superfamily)